MICFYTQTQTNKYIYSFMFVCMRLQLLICKIIYSHHIINFIFFKHFNLFFRLIFFFSIIFQAKRAAFAVVWILQHAEFTAWTMSCLCVRVFASTRYIYLQSNFLNFIPVLYLIYIQLHAAISFLLVINYFNLIDY